MSDSDGMSAGWQDTFAHLMSFKLAVWSSCQWESKTRVMEKSFRRFLAILEPIPASIMIAALLSLPVLMSMELEWGYFPSVLPGMCNISGQELSITFHDSFIGLHRRYKKQLPIEAPSLSRMYASVECFSSSNFLGSDASGS
jgi:hypothetical protein